MSISSPEIRFHAVAMDFVPHLDGRHIDMLITVSDGRTVAIECATDSIRDMRQHMDLIATDMPAMTSSHHVLTGRRLAATDAAAARHTKSAEIRTYGSTEAPKSGPRR